MIFQDKYGMDPSTLSLKEIDDVIFKGKKPKVVSQCGHSIVPSRSVFPVNANVNSNIEEIDKIFLSYSCMSEIKE